MLGAGLRSELADALGLGALRKEFRAELRALARELKALRTVVQRAVARETRSSTSARSGADASAERIRSARQLLGDSRKAFAQRLGVSPASSSPGKAAGAPRVARRSSPGCRDSWRAPDPQGGIRGSSEACPEPVSQASRDSEAAGPIHGPIARPFGAAEGRSEEGEGNRRPRRGDQARQEASAQLAHRAPPATRVPRRDGSLAAAEPNTAALRPFIHCCTSRSKWPVARRETTTGWGNGPA